jgi:hypothetical protein
MMKIDHIGIRKKNINLGNPSKLISSNFQTADGSHPNQVSDEEMQEHYDNFFEEVFVECEASFSFFSKSRLIRYIWFDKKKFKF